ncbi:MAG: hypothetical protein KJ995_00565 [Candidatus Omnitrophica bacterium]|nr:hypothetical protein [Candidatus Omnitrophota bacterium]MBU1128012.1 hypothetical protein [Candidatus Omnitrophota bacterium]MBU1657412.1 hypothetical protein [Candidatus Omnitrophota bacterium]MBU1784177.1 hypothetical protein [Candidatus Omnitrophota bacterium]MBU1850885.1 hypothetical protein [Candidatus Omnitrophota bacterium]
MGNFEKHLNITKEKLKVTRKSFLNKDNTGVGDLATKVVEQLIEADMARKGEHSGDHKSRHDYSNREYPRQVNEAMRKIWFAYGDLGYDGANGNRAKKVMENLAKVVKFFEERFGEKIDEQSA